MKTKHNPHYRGGKEPLTRKLLFRSEFGFTLMEAVVGLAIFAILVTGIIGVLQLMSKSIKVAREKAIVSSLAASYLEIVRNLPYSKVGTTFGNPNGTLPDSTAPITTTILGTTYNIYYSVVYIDDPADGLAPVDTIPNDYKQVKMFVKNMSSGAITTFVTNVSPKGTEANVAGGTLVINVINASGNPVTGANIHIQKTDNSIIVDRTSDVNGQWSEVALPAGVNAYHIVVTKAGYSTDQTYPISVALPNPVKPDATVQVGNNTVLTFAIDTLANLTIRTLDKNCNGLNGIQMNIKGAKLIGTNPNTYKFNNNYTSAGGQISLPNIEWDSYTPTLISGQGYTIIGTSPIQSINVLPGSSQIFTVQLDVDTNNSLLVIVIDAATGAPIQNAIIHLQKGGSGPQDYWGISGGSTWTQSDWSGGSGFANWSSGSNKYFSDDGNIDTSSGLALRKTGGNYAASGTLESAAFDTFNAAAQYTVLNWSPTSQNPGTTLKFQVATNNDNATWNYVGPDGTNATYFTVSGSSMPNNLNNNRYVRYKAYLSTTSSNKTPVLSNISLNYVNGCQSPGQYYFPNLTPSSGNAYTLTVIALGYQVNTINNFNLSGNQVIKVQMSR